MFTTEHLSVANNPETKPEHLEALTDLDVVVDRLLAEHANASVVLLEKLSLSKDRITCRNVVLNPNTSKDVLLRLAPQFPMDFYRNPAFDWWLLEEPDILFRIGNNVLKNILKREECPESFLKCAAEYGNEKERLAVVINPKTPVYILEALSKAKGPIGILADTLLLDNPKNLYKIRKPRGAGDLHAPGLLDEILKLSACPLLIMKWAVEKGRDEEKMSLAMNPSTPVNLLDLLVEKGGLVAESAKAHRKIKSSTPSEDPNVVFEHVVKEAVADLSSYEAKESWARGWIGPGQWVWLAPNNRLSVLGLENISFIESEWLSKYADMLHRITLSEVVQQQLPPMDLPTDHFIKLARAKDSKTRVDIAKRISTPIQALTILAKDKNVDVLWCLANNPSVPSDLLELMAQSKSKTVREAVASNPLTPKSSLEKLVEDDDFEIRKCAAVSLTSPEIFVRICSKFAVSRLMLLAGKYQANWAWLIKKLDELQASGLISEFLADEAFRLREAPQTSLVAKIIEATNPSVHLHARTTAQWAGAHYADSLAARLLGLCHPGAPPVALLGNFKSTDWRDRLAVACNPSCPPNLLAILKRDGNEMVAKMARAVDTATSAQKENKHAALLNNGSNLHTEDAALSTPCPQCGAVVKESVDSFACVGVNGEEGCGFTFKREYAERLFSVSEAEVLLRDRKIGPLPGFRSKTGSYFTSSMVMKLDEKTNAYKVAFDFAKDKKVGEASSQVDFSDQQSLGACPKCTGEVYLRGSNYLCINSVTSKTTPNPSCNFKTGSNVLQQPISHEQLKKLLTTGRTDLLEGFVSSRTQKKFNAMLVWDAAEGKVNFKFGSTPKR